MPTVGITPVVKEFYMIRLMEAIALAKVRDTTAECNSILPAGNVAGRELRRVDKYNQWAMEFVEYQKQFDTKFEQAVYDYTVLVCSGEMRHGNSCCAYINPYFPYYGEPRGRIYVSICRFDPESILKAAERIFNCGAWHGTGMGGVAWGKIAQAGLMHGTIDRVSWIDHCIDLSHNNAPYFDKSDSRIFHLPHVINYRLFLDIKRNCSPLATVLAVASISPALHELVVQAGDLGLVPQLWATVLSTHTERTIHNIRQLLQYQPVVWGDMVLPDDIILRPLFHGKQGVSPCFYDIRGAAWAKLNVANMAGKIPHIKTLDELYTIVRAEYRPSYLCPIYCSKAVSCGRPCTDITKEQFLQVIDEEGDSGEVGEEEGEEEEGKEEEGEEEESNYEEGDETDEGEESFSAPAGTIAHSGLSATNSTNDSNYPNQWTIHYQESPSNNLGKSERAVPSSDGNSTGSVAG